MENAIGVNSVRQAGLEVRVERFVKQLSSMLNNHLERPKATLTLVFKGMKAPSKKIDCYADAKKVEEKLYKISTTKEYSRMTAEVHDEGKGKITAYIDF